jgi:hypothetical protein
MYIFIFNFFSHYEEDPIYKNGICVLITPCSKRKNVTPSDTLSACGPDCVEVEEGGSCSEQCNNPGHYESGTGDNLGRCVLKSCEIRTAQNDVTFVCGYDNKEESEICVKNEETLKCSSTCENPAHFENGIDNICVERECTDREVKETVERLCGSGECYKKENEDVCVTMCENRKYAIKFNNIMILFMIYI